MKAFFNYITSEIHLNENNIYIIHSCAFAFTSASQTRVEMVHNKNIDTSITAVGFEELEELYYASEHPSLRINFDTLYDYEIHFDGKNQPEFQSRYLYKES